MTTRCRLFLAVQSTLVVLGLVLVHASVALGQAPPPQAPPPEPPPRLEANAQFAFLDTRGNATAQSLGAGGEFVWRPDPWTYSGKLIFAQTESENELTARSLAALFRAARALNPRLSVYGQYDFLRDVFAGVEQRHVIEGGISYLAVDREPHRLRFDAGLGYLHEERPDPNENLNTATLTFAAPYRFNISSNSQFVYVPRFLLPLSDTGAWKFDQDVSLTAAINTLLSLKVSHTLRYSADPPEGFKKTDTIMAVSLVAKIKRPR
jgi:putative salt-induced outer membrane protein